LGTGETFLSGSAPLRAGITPAAGSHLEFQLKETPYAATLSTPRAASAYVGAGGNLVTTSLDQLSWLAALLVGTVAGVIASICTDVLTLRGA
jgi:hypothetical protein